jgi:hypothetical protein
LELTVFVDEDKYKSMNDMKEPLIDMLELGWKERKRSTNMKLDWREGIGIESKRD